jgi:5-methylcytosine-specific restriction endonuclease McrA
MPGKRKPGILEHIPDVDPNRVAGKPYKFGMRSPRNVFSGEHDGFYESREWLELRYRVLRSSDGRCQLCGRNKHDNIRLHVDHIKPRSKYPRLQLREDNLQVLCNECNIGKSNTDETDWRNT